MIRVIRNFVCAMCCISLYNYYYQLLYGHISIVFHLSILPFHLLLSILSVSIALSCHHAHSTYSPQYMFAITFCTNIHWSLSVFLSPFTLSELSAILSVPQICFSLYSSYCQLRYGHMSIVFLFLILYSPIPSDIINLVCIHNIVLPSSLHVFPSIYLCLIVCRSLTLFLLFRPI